MGAAGSGPRPPPARRLRWLGGGSAGLLLPTVLTCTQGRVTSPASPPQPAASRRSASAPEASAALPAPQSRGHGLADTSSSGDSAASAAGAAAAASASLLSPSHHLAESLSRRRDTSFVLPPRLVVQTDGRRHRGPDCGQRQGNTRLRRGAGACARGGGIRSPGHRHRRGRSALGGSYPPRGPRFSRRWRDHGLGSSAPRPPARASASPSPSAAWGALPGPPWASQAPWGRRASLRAFGPRGCPRGPGVGTDFELRQGPGRGRGGEHQSPSSPPAKFTPPPCPQPLVHLAGEERAAHCRGFLDRLLGRLQSKLLHLLFR